ncbi:MAG: SdiA-regulated domain-containing protein [Rubripirellula sp.]
MTCSDGLALAEFGEMPVSLGIELEASYAIDHHEEGLSEPSGLAFASDGSLWTVGDKHRRLFRIDTEGKILQRLDVGNRGLEGIAIGPDGCLWVVDEDSAKILVYDSVSGAELSDHRLDELSGYQEIARDFDRHANKGLEGIAFDPLRSEMLLLKEDRPGMLIAVDATFNEIVSIELLDKEKGFVSDRADVDLSGICYDGRRDLFWIVSHQAQSVFGFDRHSNAVTHRFELHSDDDGNGVRQAEGIAVDDAGERLYVVGDKDETLFVYRLLTAT